jgi:CBS domain-containing protein
MDKTLASEIMSTELLTAREGMTIEEILKLMINNRISGMPVVDVEGKMIGIVSEFDIIRQVSGTSPLKHEAFQQPFEFSRSADAIRENTPLSEIIHKMIDTRFRRLPVVDPKGKLVGIITRADLMRIFYYRARLH